MTLDHEAIEELLAVRALGALDGDDIEALEAALGSHGECETCARLRDAYAETAGRLAFALDPEPVDPAIADRILRETSQAGNGHGAPGAPMIRPGRWTRALAVAASLAVLVAGATILRSGREDVTVTAAHRVIELDGAEVDGSIAVAFTPGEPGVLLWGRGLPDPGADRVYELWAISGDHAASHGCFRPNAGNVAAFVNAEISGADLMAITVEPASCPDAPSSDPVFVGRLS